MLLDQQPFEYKINVARKSPFLQNVCNYRLTCVVSVEDPQGDGGKDAGEIEEHRGREGLLKRLQGRKESVYI